MLSDYRNDLKILEARADRMEKRKGLSEEEKSLVNRNDKLGVLNAVGHDISQTGRQMAFALGA